VIDGRKAIGTDGQRRAGDPDGFGTFSAVVSGTKLCYGFQVVDIARPLAAHIHRGGPDESGEVVVPLHAMKVGSRCKEIPQAVAKSLQETPGDFYVNVHTKRFPNGAVRGQLAHPVRR
jgi:CHRD domain-containing protein